MSKHRDRIIRYEDLLDRVMKEDGSKYLDLATPASRDAFAEKWFRLSWPEHCVTCSHLGDATIHGPYNTEEDTSL